MGKSRYRNPKSLLIIADGGGSNGYRFRLWKTELQTLSVELNIPVSVCHLPPGTSECNKIEHQLFSFISQNWRGKPLVSHMVIVELIAATKTKAGLQVKCGLDETEYPNGRRVTDEELAAVNLRPDPFHRKWNYSILPISQARPTDRFVS